MSRSLGGGGSERQMTELACLLDRSRFQPHVGCFFLEGVRKADLQAAGVPLVEFPVRSFASPSLLSAGQMLGEYVQEHGIRIVHSFDVPANLFGVFAARWFDVPVVISSQRAFRSLTPGIYHHLLRVTDQVADAIVVNSTVLRQQLMDEDRVPARKLRLCYNAIDTNVYRPEGPSERGRFGGGVVVGSTSMFRPEKGADTLMRSFARVQTEFADAQLLLVGDGPWRQKLEALAGDLGILAKCHLTGETQHVLPWLRAIDVFVLPSLSEAFSNSLMEAMAVGCTSIASRVGGNPELIEDGVNGLLFEPGDVDGLTSQLRRLMRNAGERRHLSEAGRISIETRFSADDSRRRFQTLYEELLRAKGELLDRHASNDSGLLTIQEPAIGERGPSPFSVRLGVIASEPLSPFAVRVVNELRAVPGVELVPHGVTARSNEMDGASLDAANVERPRPEVRGADLDLLRNTDVLVQLDGDPLSGEVLEIPRFGVWQVETRDFLRPLSRGEYVTEGRVERLTAKPGTRRVLERRRIRTERFSINDNRRRLEETMAGAPARLCRLLLAGLPLAEETESAPPPETQPPAFQRLLLASRLTVRQLENQAKSLCRLENWRTGLVRASIERFLDPEFHPAIEWIGYHRPEHFVADPYLIVDAHGCGRLLAEEFAHDVNRGRIVEATVENGRVVSPMREAIREPFHLSNPFPIEHGGKLYCVPESYQAREVRLYQWGGDRWKFRLALLRNIAAVDPVLFRHDGRWWMFCTDHETDPDAALYVFYAEELLGPWSAHPANPVKVDVTSSRPGGTPFVVNGALYRPAQDCSQSYGWRLALNRIDRLTPRDFQETTVRVIDPPDPFKGIHTLSGSEGLTAIDVKSMDFSLRFTGRKLAHKMKRLLS
jgi:glycosyltransferase involved in cell wall biosynthesis